MGGDSDHQYIHNLIEKLRPWYPQLKYALYSGLPTFDIDLKDSLDYYKFGPYRPECGPLNKKTTNQKFCKKDNGIWRDITYIFQKERV